MKKASDYQDHAEECRRLAAGTSNAEHQTALTEMAEAWDTLARDRIGHLRRQERIAALEAQAENGFGPVPT